MLAVQCTNGKRESAERPRGDPRPRRGGSRRRGRGEGDQAGAYGCEGGQAAEALDRASEHLGAIDLWTHPEPSARRPRLNREDITGTAIRIADADGFAAVSMRRIAAELDAGTMSLYYYVRTKDQLLALVVDAVMAEVVIPPTEAVPADWREALTMVAERMRTALQRHSWFLDITDDPAPGPNSLRHFDQSLQAVASLPIDLPGKLDIVLAIDEYVFGYCMQHRVNLEPQSPAFDREMVQYVNSLVETGDYPQLALLIEEHGLEQGWRQVESHMRDPDRFRRNLGRLLSGIAATLPTPA